MSKTKVKMKWQVYLGLSILEMSKKVMFESWYDYIKPKHETRQNYATQIQTV